MFESTLYYSYLLLNQNKNSMKIPFALSQISIRLNISSRLSKISYENCLLLAYI